MSETPTPESLAQRLLDAQVRYHLDQLSGDRLRATVSRFVDDLLTAAGEHALKDLVDQAAVKEIVARSLGTVPGSGGVTRIVELVVTTLHDGPEQPYPLGELVHRERVELLLDELLALTPVLERALARLTNSPLVGTMSSRFMGRIVGEVLQANKAAADKVPGLGSLMSFGTTAASRVMGAADRQFEGLIGDTMGKGGTFAVRRLNKIVVETLRDPTTRAAVLEVWDLLAQESVTGLVEHVSREEIADVVDAGHALVVETVATEHAARFSAVIVEAFFDRFGGSTPTELLDELDLSREELVGDLVRIAPGVIGALRETGHLERIVRAQLEPFYALPEVHHLLG